MNYIQPFREGRIESVCESCGEAIYSGDVAFSIDNTVYCADCIMYSKFIAGGADDPGMRINTEQMFGNGEWEED